MLTILFELNPDFILACNTSCFNTAGSKKAPLALLDDLYFTYCGIDFIKEI